MLVGKKYAAADTIKAGLRPWHEAAPIIQRNKFDMYPSRKCLFFTFFTGIAPCSISALPIFAGYVVLSPHRRKPNTKSPSSTAIANSPLFPDDNASSDSNDFGGFNPFRPGSKIPNRGGFGIISDDERRNSSPTTPGGRVSPRQMRMKELTTDLLARIPDEEAVSLLLRSNEIFLLEQLTNLDAVLEPDSVFSSDMSREERFIRYQQVMDERIRTARAPAAKKALGALKDFVWSRK